MNAAPKYLRFHKFTSGQCNKVDSSFKKTLQFSIYSKNDRVLTLTSKVIYPEIRTILRCLYKSANNKINNNKNNRKDLYKAGT